MDIYEFAMQMEQENATLYRELAEKTSDAGIKRILTLLAQDEDKHYSIVKQMKKASSPQMAETEILADARSVFAQMVGQEFDIDVSHIELYQKAQGIEQKSQEFYQEQATQADSPVQKELLLKIADEEKRHYFVLENIIEFLSRPQTWLEDAEFTHLEEY
jgi:rubrerythrin